MKKYEFPAVLGNDENKEYFASRLSSNSLSHSYIICGKEGTGRKTLVYNILAALSCEEQTAPCGKCDTCGKILSHTCVDIYTIKKPEGRVYIPVSSVRAIYDTIYYTPNDLSFKAYIIEQGELMQPPCQNALLKLLEEPPPAVYFFIITTDTATLLPTVLSRCTTLNVSPLDDDTIAKQLRDTCGVNDKRINDILSKCGGSLGRAMLLAQDVSDGDSSQKNALKLLDALISSQSKFDFICIHHTLFKKTAELYSAYERLYTALCDMALYKTCDTCTPEFFASFEELEKYGNALSMQFITRACRVIEKALMLASTPTRQSLTVTEYSSLLWECKHK